MLAYTGFCFNFIAFGFGEAFRLGHKYNFWSLKMAQGKLKVKAKLPEGAKKNKQSKGSAVSKRASRYLSPSKSSLCLILHKGPVAHI